MAAVWVIFAPFGRCTGGGGGSWPEAVRLEGGGMVPCGEAAGGLAGLYPPHDSEGRDDMSVWLAEIFF